MKKILIPGIIIIIIILIFFFSKEEKNIENKKENINEKIEKNINKNVKIKNINGEELEKMLQNKDFVLIDVHIPEQEHIPGTDYMIAYNEIDKFIQNFPDKKTKIVLYCRSDSMSTKTAKELIKRGYENIYNLEGGMNQWKMEKRETIPKGKVEKI